MILAQLVDRDVADRVYPTAYLTDTPFPGDLIATADGRTVMVLRRTFLDLGYNYNPNTPVLSVRLDVRPS